MIGLFSMFKLLISIMILICSLISFEAYAEKDINISLKYADNQLDKFTTKVVSKCNTLSCSVSMFNNEYKRLDKNIKKAYGKDTVGYTYYTMSMESLCNGYMKNSKDVLNKSFKEKICLVKYSYGQLKYMGIV
ncbi:hypothetical protein FDH01_gp140 [Acinetobacter phage vB_AbaM_ME3]|uniref:Uncharacterized protein n=1 Tax=Acinetobacter phage vB_AbaM_ME3 TaxID=1837876 RepID=A0A172Q0V4_9CAUD|nr:hypothetical protein FDH01_gp140 [Acinetobacter phage vB_AbaM_ME3]AND75482.1 hypothetical protein ME3_321 [Acinetobacter phage vB_AbaM_ME3]